MSVLLWSGWDKWKPRNDLPNQEKNQYWTVYRWKGRALHTKMGAKLSGLIEEGIMLAPRPTRAGNEKP